MAHNIHKILVVDDEITSYLLITEILSKYNVNVLYASCGSEALEQCVTHSDISLVFMDIKMRVMNGFEVARKISAFRKGLPIVFQTAFAKEFLKEEYMTELGCGYMEKPIKKNILLTEIQKHINISLKTTINNVVNIPKQKNIFKTIFCYLFIKKLRASSYIYVKTKPVQSLFMGF